MNAAVTLNGKTYATQTPTADAMSAVSRAAAKFNAACASRLAGRRSKRRAFERLVIAMIEAVSPDMADDWRSMYNAADRDTKGAMLETARAEFQRVLIH